MFRVFILIVNNELNNELNTGDELNNELNTGDEYLERSSTIKTVKTVKPIACDLVRDLSFHSSSFSASSLSVQLPGMAIAT